MKCPNCQSEDIILITYGPPPFTGPQLTRAVAEKQIVLGGCLLCEAQAPAFFCHGCEHRFGYARNSPKRKSRFSKT